MGHKTGLINNQWTHSTAVGFNAHITDSNQLVLGYASTKVYIPHKLGIGTTAPANRLTVRAGANADGILLQNTNDKTILKLAQNGNEGYMNFYSNANATTAVKISINSNASTYFNNGNFGIGTSSPSTPLHVSGNGQAMTLQGTTHVYQGFNIGTTRYGYMGFAAGDLLYIVNERTAGNIYLHATGGTIYTTNNFGIGTSTPNKAGLEINKAKAYVDPDTVNWHIKSF